VANKATEAANILKVSKTQKFLYTKKIFIINTLESCKKGIIFLSFFVAPLGTLRSTGFYTTENLQESTRPH